MGLAEATLLSTYYTSILPPFSDSVYSMTIYLQHIYYKSVCTFYCTEYAMKQMDRFFSFTLSVKSGYLSQDELVDQMDTGGFCFFHKIKKVTNTSDSNSLHRREVNITTKLKREWGETYCDQAIQTHEDRLHL